MDQNSELAWDTLEYQFYEKTTDWLWAAGAIGGASFLLAILFKNFLFAIIIAIATFTVMVYAVRPPETIHCKLTRKGIQVKNTLYPYDHLTSFWVAENWPIPKLMLKSNRFFMPYLIIPLGDTDPDLVHNYLAPILAEEAHEESVAERLAEYIGF